MALVNNLAGLASRCKTRPLEAFIQLLDVSDSAKQSSNELFLIVLAANMVYIVMLHDL